MLSQVSAGILELEGAEDGPGRSADDLPPLARRIFTELKQPSDFVFNLVLTLLSSGSVVQTGHPPKGPSTTKGPSNK